MGATLGTYLQWPWQRTTIELKPVIEGFSTLAPIIEEGVPLIVDGAKVLVRQIEETLGEFKSVRKDFPEIFSALQHARMHAQDALAEAEAYVTILHKFVVECTSSQIARKLADAYQRKEEGTFNSWVSQTRNLIDRTTIRYNECKVALEKLNHDLTQAEQLCCSKREQKEKERRRTQIVGGSLSAASYGAAGLAAAGTAVASVFTAGLAAPIGMGIVSGLLATGGIAGTVVTALKAGDFKKVIEALGTLNGAIGEMLSGAKKLQDHLEESQKLVEKCDGTVNRFSFAFEGSEIVPKILFIGEVGDRLGDLLFSSSRRLKAEVNYGTRTLKN